MLKKDELKVLKLLFDDLTTDLTIMDVAKLLHQKYVQTYRTVHNLVKSGDIILKNVGNSKVVKLDFTKSHPHYIFTEMERAHDLCRKNTAIAVVRKDLQEVSKNFICILFGSQTSRLKLKSDLDLLLVIPPEYDYNKFEKIIHNKLIATNTDIVIVPESSLPEMWAHPQKLNVGNELLKKHIVLYGAEHFLNLLRKYHVG